MNEHVFSFGALTRIIAMGLLLFVAWKGMTVLIVLLIAIIISMALSPVAKKFNKKLPWGASVLLVVMFLLIPIIAVMTFFGIALTTQFPEAVEMIRQLLKTLPFIPESIRTINIIETLQGNAGYVIDSTKTLLLILGSIVTVIVSTFYLIYDQNRLIGIFLGLFNPKTSNLLKDMFAEIATVVGHYIRGNLIVASICAVVSFIGLTLFGVPFALPLAIFSGIFGLLPYIGPLIGMIPAVLLALSINPWVGLFVGIFYLVYQQLENNLIIPMIYNKALDLSPALVFLSVVIGAGVFGILGAFLALPVAASIPVIVKYSQKFRNSPSIKKTKNIEK